MPIQPVPLLLQCARIVEESPFLSLDGGAVRDLAAWVRPDALVLPGWAGAEMFEGPDATVIGWLLAYNAVNFCFWPDEGPRWYTLVHGEKVGRNDEALGVMAAFAQALRDGVPLTDGRFLAEMEPSTLEALLAPAPGAGRLPLMGERVEGLRELGRAYLEHGGPMGLLGGGGTAALGVVERLASACPRWDDLRVWRGERVRFLKRAQLCVAMIHGRFAGKGVGAFRDLDRLTVFADYRLPQILRGTGILVLDADLASRIDRGEHLAPGSPEETSLRAGAVHGAERLRQGFRERGLDVNALVVDYYLWRSAVSEARRLAPHHRTRTTDY
ncbi:MAG: hypothetical protein JRI25_09455 [Deltaproteobacteria bacterium]|nr:hypothetical protein [Deltaproteobacteria bacterium]MBW2254808.1 hypothetical protein [Deltaproteobacteria bacterium]